MISYDTNVLIYALEGSEQWGKAAQNIVQRGEREGAILSVLAWQELMTGAILKKAWPETRVAEALNDLVATKFLPVSSPICQTAVLLTKKYGRRLYGYDAIHIATAIENKAEVFFTNEKELLGLRLKELPIQNL